MHSRKAILILIALITIVFTVSVATVQASTPQSSNGTIYGAVFNDTNHNGIHDSNEGVVQGVTIQVLDASGKLAAKTTTDGNGYYQISLKPGSYVVKDVVPNGYVNTMPSTDNTIVQSNQNSKENFLISKTTQSVSNGILYGTVFNDANHNSILDLDERGVPGVAIQVVDTSGGLVAKTTTDGNGYYQISLKPGSYVVTDITPKGYVNTRPASVTTTVQSNIKSKASFGLSDTTQSSGDGSVQGVVFNDTNQNGKLDSNEKGIQGVTIQVFYASCGLAGQATTDKNGHYEISLKPGTYTVKEIVPKGYSNTMPTSLTAKVYSGKETTVNFPITSQKNGSIEGQVINNATDKGVANVTIQVYFASCGLAAQAETNSNGSYEVSLKPGSYIVNETVPSGYTSTTSTSVNATVRSDKETTVNFNITTNMGFLYVGNSGGNGVAGNITVINLTTDKVVATIPLASNANTDPIYGLAADPNGSTVYAVYGFVNGTLELINTSTNKVIKNVPVASDPTDVAISPKGTVGYVTQPFATPPHVKVINPLNNTVGVETLTESILVGTTQVYVAFTPDGSKAYFTNPDFLYVLMLNATTNTFIAGIQFENGTLLFPQPLALAFSPDGTKLYVTNGNETENGDKLPNSNNVVVINTSTNKSIATIPLPIGGPINIAVSPDGTKVYVVNYFGGTVSVINALTNTYTTTISGFKEAFDVIFNPDGTRAYVADPVNRTVYVVDTSTDKIIDSIPVGGGPTSMVIPKINTI